VGSLEAILDLEAGDSFELFFVTGDEDEFLLEGVGGDDEVVGADGGSGLFEVGADRAVDRGDAGVEREVRFERSCLGRATPNI
jgi:hypothetical protein